MTDSGALGAHPDEGSGPVYTNLCATSFSLCHSVLSAANRLSSLATAAAADVACCRCALTCSLCIMQCALTCTLCMLLQCVVQSLRRLHRLICRISACLASCRCSYVCCSCAHGQGCRDKGATRNPVVAANHGCLDGLTVVISTGESSCALSHASHWHMRSCCIRLGLQWAMQLQCMHNSQGGRIPGHRSQCVVDVASCPHD